VSIGTLLAFCVVCAATGVLRRTRPELKRPFRAPFSDPAFPAVPVLGVLLSFINMCALPASTWLRLFVWLLVGGAIYFGYGRKNAKPYLARRAKLLGAEAAPAAETASAEGMRTGLGGADTLSVDGGTLPLNEGAGTSGATLTFVSSPLAASGGAGAAVPSRQERVEAQRAAAMAVVATSSVVGPSELGAAGAGDEGAR
jgi:hypothetical protein